MPIFAIIPMKDEHKLKNAMAKASVTYLELPRGEYLVAFKGTSIELSNQLGITDGSSGLAIVIAVGTYYGRASTDIWEWVKANWEG